MSADSTSADSTSRAPYAAGEAPAASPPATGRTPRPDAPPPIQRRYSRSDARGRFPRVTGLPGLEHSRLGVFWRPIIDMTHSDHAPLRLQGVRTLSQWLAAPAPRPTSWFAIIGVPGLRAQVLRHAGLDAYACTTPAGLAEELRTPQWTRLVELIDHFADLDDATRALVVFQLAQLSFCAHASDLAGDLVPDGEAAHDRYVYEAARVTARVTGRAPRALAAFDALAATTGDPRLALAACAQGIGHSIRSGAGADRAVAFERHAERITATGALDAQGLGGDWHTHLVRSRYHRALALLRLAQRRPDAMRAQVDAALRHSDALYAARPVGTDRLVADENRRIILESQIKAAARARGDESNDLLRELSEALYAMDPNCVEALLIVGDGHATAGDHATAAQWYTRAGRLATGAGAIGWFRAAQCHDRVGDTGAALHAMGRCLELDATAIEPRAYLTAANSPSQGAAPTAGTASPEPGPGPASAPAPGTAPAKAA
ncbi:MULTISPECIES: tetratricopeptide repeat protein [unclassified Streptomyces]|uniref:tetratricopeptide repeat protein n=1 Tax=unclassified Streptomyces TaxID=2593676 RepID=UPI00371A5F4C